MNFITVTNRLITQDIKLISNSANQAVQLMLNQPAARSVNFVITRMILALIALLFVQLLLLICQLANLISEYRPKTAVTARTQTLHVLIIFIVRLLLKRKRRLSKK